MQQRLVLLITPIAVPGGTNPPGFVHGSGPALSRSGAQTLLQTVCSALWRRPGKVLRVPRLQRGEGQTSIVAPRSDLNAVTLGEVDKAFYKKKKTKTPKAPTPRDCSNTLSPPQDTACFDLPGPFGATRLCLRGVGTKGPSADAPRLPASPSL